MIEKRHVRILKEDILWVLHRYGTVPIGRLVKMLNDMDVSCNYDKVRWAVRKLVDEKKVRYSKGKVRAY